MKLNALTVAAVAMAGLALASWARTRATASTDPELVGTIFDQARSQRAESGAGIAQNFDYLRYWSSPMAGTIMGNGGLGD